MFRTTSGYLVILIINLFLFSTAHATTLVLQSGQKVEGQIIEQTELRVTMDVQGYPYTYFLGEIESIDGKRIEMPQEKAVKHALVAVNKPVVVPYYNDQEASLIRFLNTNNLKISFLHQPAAPKIPSPVVISPAPVPAPGGTGRAVIATPDGGIIVVDNDKITKYDKDFKIIKEVKLTADNIAVSK